MLKKIPVLLFSFAYFFTLAQKTILHNVYFAYDSYEMSDELRSELDSLYDKAPLGCIINLGIVGQIKSHASRSYSNTISSKRAQSVKDYLVSRGLKNSNLNIITVPYGKNRLTTGDDNMKKNTILLYQVEWLKPKDEIITLVHPDTNCIPLKKPQKFAIPRLNGNTITGKEGTVIIIPDDAFQFPEDDEMKCDVITIELIECLTVSDAVTQGLATRCGKKLLETGGMIYIMAYCNGRQLAIKKTKPLEIKIPTYNKIKGMELFIGKYTEQGPDWKQLKLKDKSDSAFSKAPDPEQINYGYKIPKPDWDGEGTYVRETDSTRLLDYYVFDLTKLGWINCDHFLNEKNLVDFSVNVDTAFSPFVRIVFSDIRSVMPGDYDMSNPGKVTFSNIPEGKRVTLVAYKEYKKKLYLSMKEITITKNMNEKVDLTQVTQSEFREKMKVLDGK
ncbi:MAG TPA: OmpA family protein [Bacteroidia bacterium]|jgi:hypothetical protein